MSFSKVVIFHVYNTLIDIQTDESKFEAYEFISSWLSYKGLIIKPNDLLNSYKERTKQRIASNVEIYPDIDIRNVFEKIITSIDKTYDLNEVLIEEICLLFRILTTKSIKIYSSTIPLLESLHKKFRLAIISNTQRLFTFLN
jgi:putative hydrolase of the HAD superfamily